MVANCNGFTAAPCVTQGAGTAYGLDGGVAGKGEEGR